MVQDVVVSAQVRADDDVWDVVANGACEMSEVVVCTEEDVCAGSEGIESVPEVVLKGVADHHMSLTSEIGGEDVVDDAFWRHGVEANVEGAHE